MTAGPIPFTASEKPRLKDDHNRRFVSLPKHATPGPWTVYRASNGSLLGIGDKTGGGVIDFAGGFWRSGDEKIANANLAAAAPQLFEAALDAVEAFKLLRIGIAHEPKAVEMIDAHIDELQTALAVAKGGKS